MNFQARRESYLSPKVGVGWQLQGDWALKISTGHAVRRPTAGGWFQGHARVDIVTNPKLKPEKGWTTEVTSEHALPDLCRQCHSGQQQPYCDTRRHPTTASDTIGKQQPRVPK